MNADMSGNTGGERKAGGGGEESRGVCPLAMWGPVAADYHERRLLLPLY